MSIELAHSTKYDQTGSVKLWWIDFCLPNIKRHISSSHISPSESHPKHQHRWNLRIIMITLNLPLIRPTREARLFQAVQLQARLKERPEQFLKWAMEIELQPLQPLISVIRRVWPDLYSRLTRKRLSFRRRDIQISCNFHRICGFEATGALVLTNFHVAACAGAEEDGVADGSYEPV